MLPLSTNRETLPDLQQTLDFATNADPAERRPADPVPLQTSASRESSQVHQFGLQLSSGERTTSLASPASPNPAPINEGAVGVTLAVPCSTSLLSSCPVLSPAPGKRHQICGNRLRRSPRLRFQAAPILHRSLSRTVPNLPSKLWLVALLAKKGNGSCTHRSPPWAARPANDSAEIERSDRELPDPSTSRGPTDPTNPKPTADTLSQHENQLTRWLT